MRFRLALLTLTCYVAFATIGCTSKPPANDASNPATSNDANNPTAGDNASDKSGGAV